MPCSYWARRSSKGKSALSMFMTRFSSRPNITSNFSRVGPEVLEGEAVAEVAEDSFEAGLSLGVGDLLILETIAASVVLVTLLWGEVPDFLNLQRFFRPKKELHSSKAHVGR